jgi:cephalosporin-C deacetylase
MLFDLPLEQLLTYRPPRTEADDFDAFWQETLREAAGYPLDATFEPVDFGLRTIETYDVTYRGYGGQPIRAWFMLPRQRSRPLPCVVEFIGYGGGRSFPMTWLLWSAAGYAHLVMDTRGQGSMWCPGDTPDIEVDGSNPQLPGFMTRGILHPRTYFYRRVFTDAVRAVQAARSHSAVDPDRVAVTGGSQGGGITLAVSGLDPKVAVAMPDLPYLCHYRRATEITDTVPYNEIAGYCQIHRDKVDVVFNTLSYFDGVNLGARAKARALFSVGLMDMTCPPSTIFAAYNHYAGPKEIKVWPYNGHEGGDVYQKREQIQLLRSLWPDLYA